MALPRRAAHAAGTLRPKFVRRGPVLAHADDDLRSCRNCSAGRATAGRSSRCRRSTPKTPTGPAGGTPTSACTACSFRGNEYEPDREVGLHYQIHRGIGVHHAAALRRGVPFRVNVFVGGPPALTLAAVMPLPEGHARAGVRRRARRPARRCARSRRAPGAALPIPADADFCITGTVDPERQLPEGPFGDHLGYYSLAHAFPVLNVEQVYHRAGAIWPFTVVGRPPQEDTTFGADHPRADRPGHPDRGPRRPRGPRRRCGRRASAAAGHRQRALRPLRRDAAGRRNCSRCANAILGQGQLSLAKYLLIVAQEDDPDLDIHDIPAFFRHLLERVDWRTRPALPDPHDDRHARLLAARG